MVKLDKIYTRTGDKGTTRLATGEPVPKWCARVEAYGAVDSAKVIHDRETGRSRGFGFVEMPNQEEAEAALDGMEGKDLMGRPLRCNESQPRERR